MNPPSSFHILTQEFLERGRGVISTRNIGMGEVILSRERPFAAVLSTDESAYKVRFDCTITLDRSCLTRTTDHKTLLCSAPPHQAYCHNCFVSLNTRRTKESCDSCG